MSATPQILLTGFGAFGRVLQNPTERVVRAMAGQEIAGQEVTGYVFPVSYTDVPDRLHALLEIGGRNGEPFDTLLLTGVALGSNHWRIEEFGRNGVGEQKDAQGVLYASSEILPHAPDLLMTSLPNDSLVSALQAREFPTRLSTSAGDYLCNFALYHALLAIQEMNPRPRVGFLHVPADEQTFDTNVMSAPVFSFEQHLEAVRILLETLPRSLP